MPKITKKSQKPRKRVLRPNTSKLIVRIIQDDVKEVAGILGINDENLKRLADVVSKAMQTHNSIHMTMIEVSKACTHANELAYIMYAMGRTHAEIDQMKMGHPQVMIIRGSGPNPFNPTPGDPGA